MSKRTSVIVDTHRSVSRCERWKAPTGRYLERGQVFRVKTESGQFKFLAFVEGDDPHIEALSLSHGVRNIRCFRPDSIRSTSKKVAR